MSKRKKRRAKAPRTLQERAEDFGTWFDKTRVAMALDCRKSTSGGVLEDFSRGCRVGAIHGALKTLCSVKGVSFPFDVRSFFAQGDLEIEILNQELPYPLPKGDFKTGVCSLVKENAEELIDLGNRTDSRGMVRSSLGFTSAVFVLDFYDALTTFAGIETLFHDS
jgi:hypothetical protein